MGVSRNDWLHRATYFVTVNKSPLDFEALRRIGRRFGFYWRYSEFATINDGDADRRERSFMAAIEAAEKRRKLR